MRIPLRPVAVLALCAAVLLGAPALAAAATHVKHAGQAKSAKPHKRKRAKTPATEQGDGGAVYAGGGASTPPPTATTTTTATTEASGGTSAGGASAPGGSAKSSTGAATRATTGSASVNAPSANTGATGVSGPPAPVGPTGASGSSGTTASGGATAPSGSTGTSGPSGATGPSGPTTPGSVAKILPDGLAEAPANAPLAVRQAIAAANQLIGQPYVYGGGHKSFISNGYDCSGAVSYSLHGASLLASPLDSSALEQWGLAGHGAWITVFTNPTHAYMDIAGIRFDTSRAGDPTGKNGPRWRPLLSSNTGFAARHPAGL